MIEPHADLRVAAASMFQLYTAYMQAGFTNEQALELLKAMIAAQAKQGDQ